MPLILYAFTLNLETQEASMIGNIPGEVALQLLQRLVIAEAIQKAKGDGAKPSEPSLASPSVKLEASSDKQGEIIA